MNPRLEIDSEFGSEAPRVVVVWGAEVNAQERSREMPPHLAALVEEVRQRGESWWPAGRKAAVRDMLRHGRYKPTGRGKPASEFLLGAAHAGQFPTINAVADASNAVSLRWGFPVSVFDADILGENLRLRWGRSGESYVFNLSGQVIEVEDLLCVCDARDRPCGNPVKDSMTTKVNEATRNVVAVIYAPRSEDEGTLLLAGQNFADLLKNPCGARDVGVRLV